MIEKRRLTVKEQVTLPTYGFYPYVSPDSSKVMYLKGVPNLQTNELDVLGYIYNVETKATHQLFKGRRNIKWLENDSICCLKKVQPSGNEQIHVFRDLIGEPIQITDHSSSIQNFEVFGDGFVFTSASSSFKISGRIGNFNHVENEVPSTGLFYVSTERAVQNLESSRLNFSEETTQKIPSFFEITSLLDEPLAIDSYIVSPEMNRIYLNCQTRSELFFEDETSCFVIELDPEAILHKLETLSPEDASQL